jgi:ubiquinone/menaquinone biosynthesis C-methylase UbiE
MEINKQYEEMSNEFIEGQEDYFSKKIDHARVFIKNQLPDLKGKVILDVGCGHGKDIQTYEELGAKEVYGIDSSESMIEEAKKRVKNPDKLFVGSMDKTPFEDEKFDIIVGRFSIHYLEDLDKMYIEFSRILKPKGIMIFTAHHPLLGFMQLGAENYHKKGIVEMSLYNNSVKIKFPFHTLKEYLSDALFEHFYLDYVDEENPRDMEYPNKWNVPGFLGFKVVKRTN